MVEADIFRPAQWDAFFVMVGGGSAALTGLVFVAMSLNVQAVTANPAPRNRASSILIGLGAVFMLSALVLMGGQDHRAIGAEVLIVSGIAGAVYVWEFVQSRRLAGSGDERLSSYRMAGGTTCYLLEIAGAIVLISGQIAGLYVICVAIVTNFYFLISGAWRLFVRLVTVHPEQSAPG